MVKQKQKFLKDIECLKREINTHYHTVVHPQNQNVVPPSKSLPQDAHSDLGQKGLRVDYNRGRSLVGCI